MPINLLVEMASLIDEKPLFSKRTSFMYAFEQIKL